MSTNRASVRARRGRFAVLALLASGALIGSSAPTAGAQTIQNTSSIGSPAQTVWLTSFTTVGQSSGDRRAIRLSLTVAHPTGRFVNALKIDQNWDGDSNDMGTHTGISVERPIVAGGFNYTRVNYSFQTTSDVTGGTTRQADATLHLRAVLDDNSESGVSSSVVRFIGDTNGISLQDVPHIATWNSSGGNFFRELTPGGSFNFRYVGDDPDTDFFSSDDDFEGVRWRRRDQLDGTPTSGTTNDCSGGSNDNEQKDTTITFPNRGTFVAEAEMMNEGCNLAANGGNRWTPLGSVDVNSSTIPNPTGLSAPRPNHNGNVTISAVMPTDPDSADGGRVQYAEWDVDGNSGNGTNGFDDATLGNHTTGLAAGSTQSTTHDTTGMTPGLKTYRVRVTDNGAMSAADSNRATSGVVTGQYLVDSLPVLTAPATATTPINTGVGIALSATDADNDTRTYSVTNAADHGTGSFTSTTGASTTYNYTPTAGYVGTDAITFQVSDGFGGTDSETVNITVGPPNTTITASPPLTSGKSNDTTPSFSFNSNGSPVTFECRLIEPSVPSPSFTTCTSGITYPAKPDGAYTFEVRAKATNGGQVDPSPASFSWTIDATKPVVSITSGRPPNPTNVQTATFNFSSNETGNFECRLDGDMPGGTGWQACGTNTTSGSSATYNSAQLDEGSHTFEVRQTDVPGNVSVVNANSTHTWVVDITDPDVNITGGEPADPTNVQTATFNFSSNETGNFECRLDGDEPGGTGWDPCGSNATTGNSPTYSAGQLDEGSHTFEVRQTDQAGNTSDPDADSTHTWVVDITAPVVAIDNASKPADPTNVQTADFTYQAVAPNAEAGDFECRLDGDGPGGTGWVPCDSGLTGTQSYDSTDLDEASHTFEVRSTDAAGNTSNIDSYTWVVDLTAPTIDITDRPADPTNATSALFKFKAISPNAEAGDFECKLDTPSTTGTFADCGMNASEGEQTYAGLSEEGVYTFTVKSTDAAGNTSTPQTYQWTIDLTPPFTSITQQPTDSDPGTSPDRSNDATPEFQFSSDAGSTFQCRIDPPSGPATTYEDCTDPGGGTGTFETPDLSGAGFGEGQYLFEAFATDPANNPGTAASHVWIYDVTPPSNTALTGPADPTKLQNATLNFSFGERGTFQCKLDGGPYGDCDDNGPALSGSATYPGPLSEGNHTFRVRSTDSAGNPSIEAVYTWEIDITPPTTTIGLKPNNPTNQTGANFTFSSSEQATSTFKCRLDNAPAGFTNCSSPQPYTGLAQGTHTFEVQATDDADNTGPAASWTWVVDTTPPTVEITGGPTGTVPTDDASFPFTAADNPSPNSGTGPVATKCKLDGGAFVDNCTSPVVYNDLDDGLHTVTVQGTDQAGNVHTDSQSWTVDTTPPETTITSDPGAVNPSPDVGFAFESNEPGSTYECSLDGGPWQPCTSPKEYGSLAEGDHNFRVRATDAVGNLDPTPDSHDWAIRPTVLGESSEGPKVVPRSDKPLVKSSGRFRVGQLLCPEGVGPCEVIRKKAKVKIGGHSYNVRVVIDHLIGDGKNVAIWVVLPPAARQPLYDAGKGLLRFSVIARGENGVLEKVNKKMALTSVDND